MHASRQAENSARDARAVLTAAVERAEAARGCLKRVQFHLSSLKQRRRTEPVTTPADAMAAAAEHVAAQDEELAVVTEELGRLEEGHREVDAARVDAREEAIATAAHDLRAMLDTIGAAASTLRGAVDPTAPHAPCCETIELTARRMRPLVDGLSKVGVFDARQLSVRASPQSARALVGAAVESFRGAALQKGIVLLVDCTDIFVVADPLRIHQVLGHLIGNAVELTPAGGRVVVGARTAGAAHAELTVSDTGPGIAEGYRAFIFSKYWRSPSSQRKGAGLGLHVARSLAELQGGTTEVDSEVGRGSTFRVRLPVHA